MVKTISALTAWIQAVRAPFFSASVIPVLTAAGLAHWRGEALSWWLLACTLLSVMLLHAGTNLINDHYDFLKGVDLPHTLGSSRVLTDNILSPRQVRNAALLCFGMGFLFGLILTAARGSA